MTTRDQTIAVITGASQRIGASLLTAYRRQSCAVVANSRAIKPSPDPGVLSVAEDISDPATAEKVINAGLAEFGRVDTLVNHAGVFVAKPFTDYTAEDYATVIGVNLAEFFNVTQRVIEPMFKQGTGNVANITTSLITTPSLGHPPCRLRSTKGGLASATKQPTIEYAASGIRVNAVPPGTIQPPMHSAESNHTLAGIHPVGRTGQIKDIVEGILFLESSSFVTGEILHIDGGQRHRPLTVWKTRCPSRQSKSPAREPRPRQAR